MHRHRSRERDRGRAYAPVPIPYHPPPLPAYFPPPAYGRMGYAPAFISPYGPPALPPPSMLPYAPYGYANVDMDRRGYQPYREKESSPYLRKRKRALDEDVGRREKRRPSSGSSERKVRAGREKFVPEGPERRSGRVPDRDRDRTSRSRSTSRHLPDRVPEHTHTHRRERSYEQEELRRRNSSHRTRRHHRDRGQHTRERGRHRAHEGRRRDDSRRGGSRENFTKEKRSKNHSARRSKSHSHTPSRSPSGSGSRQRSSRSRSSTRSSEASRTNKYDDKKGHLILHLGQDLTKRYKILSVVGEGTFGRVVECWDREERRHVAVKIVRAIEKYREAALIELDVLQVLKKKNAKNDACIELLSWFEYKRHICLTFPKYGPSLYDFLKNNSYAPFPISFIKDFAYQLINAVAFMHDLTLIHTDLKPENILLVAEDWVVKDGFVTKPFSRRVPASAEIKLIDFGSATFDAQHHTTVVSTRHYRAPEVILGMGWTYPCDMWSIGCILIELYTGEALFQTHENVEHLAMMERVLGPIPKHLARDASHSARKLFKNEILRWPELAEVYKCGTKHVKMLSPLRDIIRSTENDFYDVLLLLLEYDPARRISARNCLSHPFFSDCHFVKTTS